MWVCISTTLPNRKNPEQGEDGSDYYSHQSTHLSMANSNSVQHPIILPNETTLCGPQGQIYPLQYANQSQLVA